MRLLAIDNAINTSGLSVFIDGKLEYYGHFTTDSKLANQDRLRQLHDKIIELYNNYNIDTIAYEDIQLQGSVGNNVQTFKVLGQVQGMIMLTCSQLGVETYCVSSNTWKSTVGIKKGKRAEQKKAAQDFVESTYGVHATQDEADSICIGTHIQKKLG